MEIRANIAETIRRAMRERGENLTEFSASMDIPLSSMKEYANGTKNVRADTIELLAQKLGMPPAVLISLLPFGWAEAEVIVQTARALGALPKAQRKQGIEIFLTLVKLFSEQAQAKRADRS